MSTDYIYSAKGTTDLVILFVLEIFVFSVLTGLRSVVSPFSFPACQKSVFCNPDTQVLMQLWRKAICNTFRRLKQYFFLDLHQVGFVPKLRSSSPCASRWEVRRGGGDTLCIHSQPDWHVPRCLYVMGRLDVSGPQSGFSNVNLIKPQRHWNVKWLKASF